MISTTTYYLQLTTIQLRLTDHDVDCNQNSVVKQNRVRYRAATDTSLLPALCTLH